MVGVAFACIPFEGPATIAKRRKFLDSSRLEAAPTEMKGPNCLGIIQKGVLDLVRQWTPNSINSLSEISVFEQPKTKQKRMTIGNRFISPPFINLFWPYRDPI